MLCENTNEGVIEEKSDFTEGFPQVEYKPVWHARFDLHGRMSQSRFTSDGN